MCVFTKTVLYFYAPLNAGKTIRNNKFTIYNKLKLYFYHKFVIRKRPTAITAMNFALIEQYCSRTFATFVFKRKRMR